MAKLLVRTGVNAQSRCLLVKRYRADETSQAGVTHTATDRVTRTVALGRVPVRAPVAQRKSTVLTRRRPVVRHHLGVRRSSGGYLRSGTDTLCRCGLLTGLDEE